MYLCDSLKLKTTMKTQVLRIFTLAIVVTLFSCNDKAKEAETTAAADAAVSEASSETFKVDTAKSSIEWKGFKPTGSRNGTIALSEGRVMVNNGTTESGSFTIDMNTIVVTDIPAEDDGNADLTGHLKSGDFFDVATYPTAKFVVTSLNTVEGKTMLSGNLTMKDATNNVSIPVTTSINGNKMTLTSETFTIDRSKWNIKYGSKSFFDNLGDKFINDEIELKVNLTAMKG